MSIGSNIKRLREMHDMNQAEMAEIAGVTDKAVSTWEHDKKIPRMGAIQKIADYFKITKSDIIEGTVFEAPNYPGILPIEKKKVPLLGDIACGEPIYAQEDYNAYMEVGNSVECDFALRCKGDSMVGARIYDGDIVFVKKQDYVDDGSIAVVLLDDEATLKRIYHIADGRIELKAENPTFKKMIIGGPDETRSFRILGKAVGFYSNLA